MLCCWATARRCVCATAHAWASCSTAAIGSMAITCPPFIGLAQDQLDVVFCGHLHERPRAQGRHCHPKNLAPAPARTSRRAAAQALHRPSRPCGSLRRQCPLSRRARVVRVGRCPILNSREPGPRLGQRLRRHGRPCLPKSPVPVSGLFVACLQEIAQRCGLLRHAEVVGALRQPMRDPLVTIDAGLLAGKEGTLVCAGGALALPGDVH